LNLTVSVNASCPGLALCRKQKPMFSAVSASDSPHRDEGKESKVQDMVGVVGDGRKSQVVPMIIRPSVIAARRPIPEGV